MKRLLLAAVAGLCSFAPVRAQEGVLAPTVPVVPAPVLQDGKLLAPSGGRGGWGATSGPRLLSFPKLSPVRSPVVPSTSDSPVPPPAYAYPMPPLPAGVGGVNGNCGAAGCGHDRDRNCWEKFKAWATYHPSPTGLPKLRPTPYITPLQGMFPCTSSYGYGCAVPVPAPLPVPIYQPVPQPLPPPMPQPHPPQSPMPNIAPPPTPIPQPMPMPATSGAGPVVMPPRGVQGSAINPTWQGRTTPIPASPGIAGYRYATPAAPTMTTVAKPTVYSAAPPGTVISTSGSTPRK